MRSHGSTRRRFLKVSAGLAASAFSFPAGWRTGCAEAKNDQLQGAAIGA